MTTDPDTRSADLDLDPTEPSACNRHFLRRTRVGHRRRARWIDPHRHEPRGVDASRLRHLAPPYCQQPAHHPVPPRDLGYIRPLFETLRDDPRLLLSRPPTTPALSCDDFDPAIRSVFLPGINHGICHRFTSNDQLMPGCIAGAASRGEMGRSRRLRRDQRIADE
jgi:hypothetical protein